MKKTATIIIWVVLVISCIGLLFYAFDQQIEATRNMGEALRLYELNQVSDKKIKQLEIEKDSLLMVIKELDKN